MGTFCSTNAISRGRHAHCASVGCLCRMSQRWPSGRIHNCTDGIYHSHRSDAEAPTLLACCKEQGGGAGSRRTSAAACQAGKRRQPVKGGGCRSRHCGANIACVTTSCTLAQPRVRLAGLWPARQRWLAAQFWPPPGPMLARDHSKRAGRVSRASTGLLGLGRRHRPAAAPLPPQPVRAACFPSLQRHGEQEAWQR